MMVEQEWLTSENPQRMLHHLMCCEGFKMAIAGGSVPSIRKLRLFACACCRQMWHLLTDPRSRKAVEVAEQYADGIATTALLQEASLAAFEAMDDVRIRDDLAGHLAWWTTLENGSLVVGNESLALILINNQFTDQPAAASGLLRDIIGNPFRSVTFDPIWRTPTVLGLAQAAYGERSCKKCSDCFGKGSIRDNLLYSSRHDRVVCGRCHNTGRLECGHLDNDRLAVLADALEDAGCPPEVEESCPRCSLHATNPCPECKGKKIVISRGKWSYFDQPVRCPTCHGAGTFPPGYHPECDPASGRHEGGWTNCKTCNGGSGSVRLGVVKAPNPLLLHLHSPGSHVRGCWAIDLILSMG